MRNFSFQIERETKDPQKELERVKEEINELREDLKKAQDGGRERKAELLYKWTIEAIIKQKDLEKIIIDQNNLETFNFQQAKGGKGNGSDK